MTREELEMRTLVRESDVIDRTDGSELAKAFNHLWEKYVEQEQCEDAVPYIYYDDVTKSIKGMPSVNPQEPKTIQEKQAESEKYQKAFDDGYANGYAQARFDYEQEPKTGHWIPVSERLPELNKPLLVTAYHRVCYAHMISESGNYGYPVFRLHEIKDSDRGWVQETISHEPYSRGRIDAWMYIDIPEPYKVEPQERSNKE